jgi:hypothetical protein
MLSPRTLVRKTTMVSFRWMDEFRKKRILLSPEVPMNNFAKDSRLQRISNFVFSAACRLIPKRIRLPSMREPIFETHLLEVGLLRLRILWNVPPRGCSPQGEKKSQSSRQP